MEKQAGAISSSASRGELSLELVRATEAAALACARFLGKGDPDRVLEAAGDAMRRALEASGLSGPVVVSPRHQTYFQRGAVIAGGGRHVDFGVFPIEGASQVARGHINAVSVVVAVEPGGFAELPEIAHMERIAAGASARGALDPDDSIADNLRRIAFARDMRVQDLTVAILERPRHQELIAEVAAAGARIRQLEEGDFASAVMAALPETGIDAAVGVGDPQAALMAAAAIRCLGGELKARLRPRNAEEIALIGDLERKTYALDELSPATEVGVAITGVTGGPLLPGVSFGGGYAETTSLLMSSRFATLRRMTTRHHVVGDPG